MADNTTFDNSLATTRLIEAAGGVLTYQNNSTDNSFSIGPGDSNDYYKLTVSRSSNVIVKLNPDAGDLSLSLLDSSGSPVLGSTTNNPNSLADAVVTDAIAPLQPGQTYYVRVYGSSTTNINYKLTVESSPLSRADLLWRNISPSGTSGSGTNAIWRMNGVQLVSAQATGVAVDPSWTLQAAGDFDRDGAADYIWHQRSSGALAIWLMDGVGTGIRSTVALPSLTGDWFIGGVGDFGGDSSLDLVWRYAPTGATGVWIMNRTSFVSAVTIDNIADANWAIAAVGDFNGDTEADLFFRNYSTGENVLWLMQNTQFKSSQSFTSLSTNWVMEGTGDFNGDGSTDLVWRDYSQGSTSVWYLNQTNFLSAAAIATVDPRTYIIAGVITNSLPVDLAGNSTSSAFSIGKLDNTGIYTDVVGPSDLQDYYAFTLQGASKIGITANGTGLSALTDIEVLAVNGTTVLGSTTANGADEEKLTNLLLDPGTYYVRLKTSATTDISYAISIAAEEQLPINLFFPTLTSPETVTTFKNVNGTPLTQPVSVKDPFTFDLEYKVTYLGRPLNEFKVGFYLSKDGALDANDYRFDLNGDGQANANDVDLVQNRAPNTVITETQRLILPSKDSPFWVDNGAYNILIVLDPANEILERDPQTGGPKENDNIFAAPITVRDARSPDLTPQEFNVNQAQAVRGSAINLSGLVRNIGRAGSDTGNAAGSPFSVRFYLSNTQPSPGTRPVDISSSSAFLPLGSSISLATLATGAQTSIGNNVTRSLPSNWAGYTSPTNTYYVLMVVDPTDTLNEITDGELNNIAFDSIVIT